MKQNKNTTTVLREGNRRYCRAVRQVKKIQVRPAIEHTGFFLAGTVAKLEATAEEQAL